MGTGGAVEGIGEDDDDGEEEGVDTREVDKGGEGV